LNSNYQRLSGLIIFRLKWPLVVFLLMSACFVRCFAEPLADDRYSSLSDEEISLRIDFLNSSLKAGERGICQWDYGWIAANGALAMAGGVAYSQAGNDLNRAQAGYNGAVSALTLGYIILSPFYSLRNNSEKLDSYPSSDREEKITKLKAAEKMLDDSARAEINGRSWLSHALGVVLGAAAGLSLSENYGGKAEGAGSFIGMVAFNEAMIFTQPVRAVKDRDEYTNRFRQSTAKNKKHNFEWQVYLCGNKAGIFAVF
jgi:hypothetical protein